MSLRYSTNNYIAPGNRFFVYTQIVLEFLFIVILKLSTIFFLIMLTFYTNIRRFMRDCIHVHLHLLTGLYNQMKVKSYASFHFNISTLWFDLE